MENNAALNRLIGLCPEQDAFFEWMTGPRVLDGCALTGRAGTEGARARGRASVEQVRMTEHAGRPVRGYSKGMRQQIKLAQAMVHDPLVLFLDEPLTGTDPVARRELIDLISRWGRRPHRPGLQPCLPRGPGRHPPDRALEPRAPGGRRATSGSPRPDRQASASDRPQSPAAANWPPSWCAATTWSASSSSATTARSWSRPGFPTGSTAGCRRLALDGDTPIDEVYSDDDNLEAVFKYLVNPSTYHLASDAGHVHLVCQICGKIDEATRTRCPLTVALDERHGFETNVLHLTVFGRCHDCRSKHSA